MKRFLKWFLGILFLFIILIVGTIVALPHLIDPNEYKADIIAQIKPHLRGRDLQIPGEIKLSIVPWLGIETGEIIVGNADGFVLKPFVTIKSSKAHIKLFSLFSDTPEIGTLALTGIQVNLQRDAEGRNNWSDLAMAKPQPNYFIKTSSATSNPSASPSLPPLKVAGIHLHDVNVQFDDKQSQDVITLSRMQIDAGPIHAWDPIPVKGKFNLQSKKNALNSASAFATQLVITQDLATITLNNLTLNTNLAVQKETIKTSLQVPSFIIEPTQQKLAAKPFYLTLDSIKSEGHISVRRFDNPIVRLGWEIEKLDLDKLIPRAAATTQPEPQTAPQVATIQRDDEVAPEGAYLFAPLIALRNADLQGTIKIGQLRVQKLDLEKVKVSLLARNGLVSALPEATLYGGSYSGDVQINMKTQPTTLRTKQVLSDVQIGPIAQALHGKEIISGQLRFQGQFFSEGGTQKQLTENLNGDGQFNIRKAQLKTLDTKQLLLGKWYDKVDLVKEKQTDKKVTAFDSMRGTLRIKSGVVFNRDFDAVSDRVHLKGDGYANLNNQSLKYTLTTIPKKSLAFSLAGQQYELKDKRIPTYISGSFTTPAIDNDIEEVLKAEFKQGELYQKKRAKEDKIKAKLQQEKDKLKNKLKQLFN